MIAMTEFHLPNIIGMACARTDLNLFVILRASILIAHDNRNRSPQRLTFENSTGNFRLVAFISLGYDFACLQTMVAWSAPLKFFLEKLQIKNHIRRTAFNHTAQSSSVTFAESMNLKMMSECICAHLTIPKFALGPSL